MDAAVDTDDSRYLGFVLAVVLQLPRTSARPRLVARALAKLTDVVTGARPDGQLAPLASTARRDRRRWE